MTALFKPRILDTLGVDRIYKEDNEAYLRLFTNEFRYYGIEDEEFKIGLSKNGTLSSNNVQYYLSHRADNEDFWIYTFNGSSYWNSVMIDYSAKTVNIRDSLIVGNGSSQGNITLTSPDGTEYSCGVANGGAFSCS